MAVGDRIPTELIAPQAITASAVTYFTNTSASYRTQMLEIILNNTGTSQRAVTLYKNGTNTANQIMSGIIIPPLSSVIITVKLIFTGTQTLSANQDTGTDVNISASGIVEQIA